MGDKHTINSLGVQMNDLLRINKQNQEILNQIPKFLTRLEAVEDDIKSVETRTTTLEAHVTDIYSQLSDFGGKCANMSLELNRVQQQNMKHSFTIRGLPGDLPKNLALKVVLALGTVTGIHLTADDFIATPFVVYHQDRKESHIVGTFHDLRMKQKTFQKFKENQPITVEDLCDGLDSQSPFRGKKVLLKNRLTKANQQLLYNAQQHTDIFLYVWESKRRILARRTADAPLITIFSHNHLLEIIARIKAESGEKNKSQTKAPKKTAQN